MNHLRTIAKNTYLETVRDRIVLGSVLFLILTIVFGFFVATLSVGQDVRVFIDIGLTALFLLQIFIAVFVGSTLFQKEVDRKTLFLLLPKPVSREGVLIGKTLGLSLTLVVVGLSGGVLLSLALLLKGAASYVGYLLLAVLFGTLESAFIATLALTLSLWTTPILTAILTTAFFLIGHSGSILLAIIEKSHSAFVKLLLSCVYYILPNLEKANLRGGVLYKEVPNLGTLLLVLASLLLYVGAALLLGRLFFRKKEY